MDSLGSAHDHSEGNQFGIHNRLEHEVFYEPFFGPGRMPCDKIKIYFVFGTILTLYNTSSSGTQR